MRCPFFLPPELSFCTQFDSASELLTELSKHPLSEQVQFYEAAAQDETWLASIGNSIIPRLYQNFSDKFLMQALHRDLAKRIVKVSQEHFDVLEPYLKDDIQFIVEGESQAAKSLFFGANSDFFYDLINHETSIKRNKNISLPKMSTTSFNWLKEFFYTSSIDSLWREAEKSVFGLIEETQVFEIESLSHFVTDVLKRYFTIENIDSYVSKGKKMASLPLITGCCDFLNQQDLAMEFFPTPSCDLSVKIYSFRKIGLLVFDKVKKFIKKIQLSDSSTLYTESVDVITQCPNLKEINLSNTESVLDDLLIKLPQLNTLDLSFCKWLRDEHFFGLTKHTHLSSLNLQGNQQLTQEAWLNLPSFTHIHELNVSFCDIGNEELSLIAYALPRISHLNLANCRITDEGLLLLSNSCQNLRNLDIRNCPISEEGLVNLLSTSPTLQEVRFSSKILSTNLEHIIHSFQRITIIAD